MATRLAQAIKAGRIAWEAENGRCTLCAVGDVPHNGRHGQHACGNEPPCSLCRGCLPPGEICKPATERSRNGLRPNESTCARAAWPVPTLLPSSSWPEPAAPPAGEGG